MNLKFYLISILIVLLGLLFVIEAGTFKPFVRSRYSLRWRKSTETPKIWASSTASLAKEDIEKISTNPVQNANDLTENSIQVTTIKTMLRTSTHSSDYDYYNNEVEEGDHKN